MRSGVDLAGLRRQEFARLDASGSVYLDYTGAALYPASLVRRDGRRLATTVLGNPHAESGPSQRSTDAMQAARTLTLQFFNADPAQYDVVFTANASGAIRMLAEAFPFHAGGRLVLTADNHNSVNGLRLPARQRRARVTYVPLARDLRAMDPLPFLPSVTAPSLFAFPAQSNFSGVMHPLGWIGQAQARGYRVLLDAAAFAANHRLSLADAPADFVAISYYKLFGYPTGVGALIARRDALAALTRGYFAGGAVQFVSVRTNVAIPRSGAEGFEDGTPHFLAMPAVSDGLRWLQRIGIDRIEEHANAMTARLLTQLRAHKRRAVVYGPDGADGRGGTVAFNLRRRGQLLPYEDVEAAARDAGIAIRGGCFCNPGAAEYAFAIPPGRLRACIGEVFSKERLRTCLEGRAVGALRASVGLATSVADLDRLDHFVATITQ